jgi:EpsD family peptidyl-prolyl cis-trans isomerase
VSASDDYALSTTKWSAARLFGLVMLSALAACSSKSGDKNSQVVATVNGKEITVTQLDRVLRSVGAQEVTPELTRKALDSLTEEELLVQAALDNKIDRDPAFVQALEQSRRQLLGQFFTQRNVYPKSAITAEEIQNYYKSQPLLFAERKKFRLTTFVVGQAEMTDTVRAALQDVNSIEQIRSVLDTHAIEYVTHTTNILPEQLPVNELPAFAAAKVGDLFINDQGGGKVVLMAVAAIEDDIAIPMDRAKPMIEEYLKNARNRAATADYLKQVKDSAKISYVGAAENAIAAVTDDAPELPLQQDAYLKKGLAGIE